MPKQMRNEWLDIDESDGSADLGYDSESKEDSRAEVTRKRRRLNSDNEKAQSEDEELEVEDESFESRKSNTKEPSKNRRNEVERHSQLMKDGNKIKTMKSNSKAGETRRLVSKPKSKSGVVYISRIPPFMKPSTLRSLLSPHGAINRVFLTPEDASIHSLRVKSGGNKKRSFVDGWVEFVHKRDAKAAAEILNAQIIGGKKGSWYHDDVWNVKYLKGFKWHHLTEQIANENAERAARLRTEIAQTTQENRRFIKNVEKAKMLEGIKTKRLQRHDQTDKNSPDATSDNQVNTPTEIRAGFKSHFRQNEVRTKDQRHSTTSEQPDEVSRVLNKIL